MRKRPYTCENPGCLRVMRITETEYARRARQGQQRALCDICLTSGANTHSRQGQRESRTRDTAGVIVTCRQQDSGQLMTLHRSGLAREALTAACKTIDNLDGDWKIVSISTPRTILRDLEGPRKNGRVGQGGGSGVREEDYTEDSRQAERLLLGSVHRLDLLEPPPHTIHGYPRILSRR